MDNSLLNLHLAQWANNQKGYFVTLNNIQNDKIQFEQNLGKLAHRLNNYCYGRAYERKEKQLKIIAGIEVGKINTNIHAHLVITHNDDTKRSFADIDCYIRKEWSALIGIKNPYGSMIDFQHIGDIQTRISYLTKDTSYWLGKDQLNITVL